MALPAQSSPAASTLTDAYIVPASTTAVISSIIICNTAGTTRTIRLSVAIGGAADNIKQYIYYGLQVTSGNTLVLVAGIGVLNATDAIRVWASGTGVAFNINGEEVTV